MLISTHFENLWILDATMVSEILDSSNAMGRCIGGEIEIEKQCIGNRRLTAQNIVYIDGWIGFLEQVPGAFDTWSGID
jgi:hypothetical protein